MLGIYHSVCCISKHGVGKQSWSEVEWSLNISFNTRNLDKSLNTSDPLSTLQKPSLDHLLCIAHLAPVSSLKE